MQPTQVKLATTVSLPFCFLNLAALLPQERLPNEFYGKGILAKRQL